MTFKVRAGIKGVLCITGKSSHSSYKDMRIFVKSQLEQNPSLDKHGM